MNKDEDAAAKKWKEYYDAINKFKLDYKWECRTIKDHMYDGFFAGFYAGRDYQRDKSAEGNEDAAKESEKLINELEGIYLSGSWRKHPEKSLRVAEITARLGRLFAEAEKYEH